MTSKQILELILTNRDFIQCNNPTAYHDLQRAIEKEIRLPDEEVTLNLELNNSLVARHFHSNHDKAIENSLRVIREYANSEHRILLAKHHWVVGHCSISIGNYDQAEAYLLKALHDFGPVETYPLSFLSDIFHCLAMNNHFRKGDPAMTLNYLQQGLDVVKDGPFPIRRSVCYTGMGNVYFQQKDYQNALNHYALANEVFEEKFDLGNMAVNYSNIGNCYTELGDWEKAEYYLLKSLDLRQKAGTPADLSISYFSLANLYEKQKDYDRAYENLLRSHEILLKTSNKPDLIQTLKALEKVATQKHDIPASNQFRAEYMELEK